MHLPEQNGLKQTSPAEAGAFVTGEYFDPPLGSGVGALGGIRVAIKDNIDIAGRPTGNGHPDWPEARHNAARHAHAVARLLESGAHLVGKTVMDDLAFSLVGDNCHFGAPPNPRDPARYCGGSSCGAASAVAAFHTDIALGTDTAGSVRVPAAATGLLGLRPSHGMISMAGVCPLSPRFDTLGLLARDGAILSRVAAVLGLPIDGARTAAQLIWPAWAFASLDPVRRETSLHAARQLARDAGVSLIIDDGQVPAWFEFSGIWFAALQRVEVAATIGPWVKRHRPHLTGDISARVDAALAAPKVYSREVAEAEATIEHDLENRAGDALIAWPTMGGPTPYRNATPETLASYRNETIRFTALSPLTRRPELTIPIADSESGPIGLSVIAPRGKDAQLLTLATLCQAKQRNNPSA